MGRSHVSRWGALRAGSGIGFRMRGGMGRRLQLGSGSEVVQGMAGPRGMIEICLIPSRLSS